MYAVEISDIDSYNIFLQKVPGSSPHDEVYITHGIIVSGIPYRSSMFIAIGIDKETGDPIFGELMYIIVMGGNVLYFHGRKWQFLYFSRCYHAYAVKLLTPETHLFVKYEELMDVQPLHKINKTEQDFIDLKYAIS